MIDALIADEITPLDEGLSVRCGAIALWVLTPQRDRQQLLDADKPTSVFCELESRDEQLLLNGFYTAQRRDLYRSIRKISGIGQHTALKVLDCGQARDILRAAASSDKQFFRTVPGLGVKRIELLVQQLSKRSDLPRPTSLPISWLVEARESLGDSDQDQWEVRILDLAEQQTFTSLEQLVKELEGAV